MSETATIQLNGAPQAPRDFRDIRFGVPWWIRLLKAIPVLPHALLPSRVDLRPNVLRVFHQGALNACTANAAAALFQYVRFKTGNGADTPSRLFIYWQARNLAGKAAQDCGSDLRTTLKALAKFGAPPEWLWPYSTDRFSQAPPPEAAQAAEAAQVLRYEAIEGDLVSLKATLAEGCPFVFGLWVGRAFLSGETAKSGEWVESDSRVGQHAVFCVGYDHGKEHFICLNSFGASWGDGGYFYLPYEVITRDTKAFDFWTLRKVE